MSVGTFYPRSLSELCSPVNIIPDFKSQKFRPADDPRPMYKYVRSLLQSLVRESG